MKVLLVRIDDDVYGLPAVDVDAVGRLDPKDVAEVAGIRAVRYRDRLLPLVALGPAPLAQRRPAPPAPHRGLRAPRRRRRRRWWWTASSASARWRSRPRAPS